MLTVTDVLTTCVVVVIRVKVNSVQWIDGIKLEPENVMTPCYCVRYKKVKFDKVDSERSHFSRGWRMIARHCDVDLFAYESTIFILFLLHFVYF